MAKRSLDKGKAGEREAAAEISRLFGVDARRGQQFAGGSDSPDIVTGIDGVHFEVKRCEKQRIYDWIEQARRDAAGTKAPVVLHRQNKKQWLAVVPLEDLPLLAVKLYLTLSSQGTAHDQCS